MRYPFIKCFDPKVVTNKYTGDTLLTNCGICKACSIERANRMSLLCGLEEQCHKYCMFVTLTYDMYHLPVCDFVYHPDSDGYVIFNRSERINEGYLGWFPEKLYPRERLELLRAKMNLGGLFCYSYKRDVQLFLKRFRKRIFKHSHEKIRYYAVSEYGPVHFRAHFHLLFYFEEESTLEIFSSSLHEAWKYGRIDWSLSRGKCSSYVSQYVNSDVSLPPIFGVPAIKPWCTHSKFFASELYRSKKEEIYSKEDKYFTSLVRQVSGKVVEFAPWRSLTSCLYPRCAEYSRKSHDDLYQSYTILFRCWSYYGRKDPVTGKSYSVTDYVDKILYDVDLDLDHPLVRYFRLLEERCTNLASRIYSELYISKHFLSFVCDDRYDTFFMEQRVKRIEQFYNSYEYKKLVDWYSSQEDYLLLYPGRSEDMKYFRDYHIVDDVSFKDIQIYKDYFAKVEHDFEFRIKHRELNDANGIFL